jgi:hypothetical protein
MRHIAKPAQASLLDAEDAVRRILLSLDTETARLSDQQQRHHFLELLHEQFTSRLMRESIQPESAPILLCTESLKGVADEGQDRVFFAGTGE